MWLDAGKTEHEPIAALEHDRLGQAAEHDMTRLCSLQSRRCLRMFHHIVFDTSRAEILRESNCNAHGTLLNLSKKRCARAANKKLILLKVPEGRSAESAACANLPLDGIDADFDALFTGLGDPLANARCTSPCGRRLARLT